MFFKQLLVLLFVAVDQSQSQHVINHANDLSAKLLLSQLCILLTLYEQNSFISVLKSADSPPSGVPYSRHFIAAVSVIEVLKSRNARRKGV